MDGAELVFAVIGSILVVAMYFAWRAGGLLRVRRLVKRYPKQPWRWTPQWETGRISSEGLDRQLEIWSKAFAIAALACFFFMPALGWVILLSGPLTVYRIRQDDMESRSAFHNDNVPGVLGDWVVGFVHMPFVQDAQSFSVRLSCEQGMRRKALWSKQHDIPAERAVLDGTTSIVPVRFAIPDSLPSSGHPHECSRTAWRLSVTAHRRFDRSATFEVPVVAAPVLRARGNRGA